jgi:hypothetical protein
MYDAILKRKLKDLRVFLKVSEINTITHDKDNKCYNNLKKYFTRCYELHKSDISDKETIINKLKETINIKNDDDLNAILKDLKRG